MNMNMNMNNNISFDIDDTNTYMTVDENARYYNTSIAYISNAKTEERIQSWTNRLEGSEYRGCAINSLVFMGEMNIHRGIQEVENIMLHQPYGTPFNYIINWFNSRITEQNRIYIIEHVIYIKNKIKDEIKDEKVKSDVNITSFINTMNNQLPNDTMTIVKLNRDEEIAKQHNLCPGHTVIICKNNKGNLYYFDPQKLNIYNLHTDQNVLTKICTEQFYSSVSIPFGYQLPRKLA